VKRGGDGQVFIERGIGDERDGVGKISEYGKMTERRAKTEAKPKAG
jgi:hypothetical protein